MFPSFK
jgi:hypothetical protein